MQPQNLDTLGELKRQVEAYSQPLPLYRAIPFRLADMVLRVANWGSPRGEINLARIRKILIYGASGLGNTIQLIPAYRRLRALLPQAKVWVIAKRATQELYQSANFDIARFLPRDEYTGPLGYYRLLRLIRAERFDLSLRMFTVHGFGTSYLTALSRIPLRLGHRCSNERHQLDLSYVNTHVVPDQPVRHEVQLNLELVNLLARGTPCPEPDYNYRLTSQETSFAERFLREHGLDQADRRVGFHVGCRDKVAFKSWPLDYYVQLANRLVEEHQVKPILFWGPDERETIDTIAPRIPGAFRLPGILPLTKVAALVNRCHGFISNDSGLMHLAAALGVPTVGILGPTDPARACPFGPSHGVARLDILCSPCYDKRVPIPCRRKTPYCLEHLTVEHVMAVVEQIFPFLPSRAER